MGYPRPLFSLFSSFQYTVDSKQMFNINKFLLMTGFEPRTSDIRSNCSTNWATTTAPIHSLLYASRLFHSFPFNALYIIIILLFLWHLCMKHICFENVHCSYINLIDSKYNYQYFERLHSSSCHYSQNNTPQLSDWRPTYLGIILMQYQGSLKLR